MLLGQVIKQNPIFRSPAKEVIYACRTDDSKTNIDITRKTFVESIQLLTVKNIEVIHDKKSPYYGAFCDPDGTRTRDLRRDRAAF